MQRERQTQNMGCNNNNGEKRNNTHETTAAYAYIRMLRCNTYHRIDSNRVWEADCVFCWLTGWLASSCVISELQTVKSQFE